MLTITIPPDHPAERAYILRVVFAEFLGLAHHVVVGRERDTHVAGPEGRSLTLTDGFFGMPEDVWLKPASMPPLPLATWHAADLPGEPPLLGAELPMLFGAEPWLVRGGDAWRLGADLLGGMFFMLSRYEEALIEERDEHDRFPASAALAHRAGFAERPLVNEYLEVLWGCLRTMWPGLVRRPRPFGVRLTHDVDWPLFGPSEGVVGVARTAAGDLVRRRSPMLAARRLASGAAHRLRLRCPDPYDTFDWLMARSEEQNLRSAFFFIADHTAGKRDGVYSLGEPWIRDLLRRIHRRGHEIGLHPSYHTYRDPNQLAREFAALVGACREEGIEQVSWGGRQHYLRWAAPVTWQAWEDAGLDYDSTLGFAQEVGFRCGTCYDYPVFNVVSRTALRLRERPLIAMDATILEARYMGLQGEAAFEAIVRMRRVCQRFGGDFVLLWHNNRLLTPLEVDLYTRTVALGEA